MSGSREADESEAAQKILTWAFLGAFSLLAGVGQGLSAVAGADTESLDFVSRWGFNWLAWHWLVAQNRPYRATYPLDTGWLAMLAWAPVAGYYLWRFERWRGLGKVALVIGMWLGGAALALLVRAVGSLFLGLAEA